MIIRTLEDIQKKLVGMTVQLLQADVPIAVTLKPYKQTRSAEQNRKMWAVLRDISQQVEWHGHKLSPEDWKHIFSAAQHGQRMVPGINMGDAKPTMVMLGQYTSKMNVSQMSELIEIAQAFGAEHGVEFGST